ncbi:glutathione S-transferase [Phyllobacterium sp. SB3]|uniref:glutathione S-transferase family protein n=1 Tax=Phyllobacterium sp. SB3 TaxID=3156073 RepID=UPI0032AF9FA7
MTQILFYGVPEGCSFGSIVALEWSKQPYRLSRIEMPETVTSAAYRQINPVAETPTLRTSTGEFISESMAILNHIGAGAIEQGIAFRQGTKDFDRLNQMLAFLNTTYFSAYASLWYALEHVSDGNEKETLIAYGRTNVAKAHEDLELLLGNQQWLLGDKPTLADAYFMGIARWSHFHKTASYADYPGLNKLHQRLEDDAAVKFAHAIEHEKEAKSAGGFAGHISFDDVLKIALEAV